MLKVSVSITAYNSENFIIQAIESVLMQEVNFDYEIVIGEDCSKDKTRDIVLSYQKKYPHKIRVLLNEKNLGLNKNFVSIIQACQGQYIALLDHDDYWTSPLKLQKQVDFLESHPECSMCFHDSRHFYQDGSKEDGFIRLPRKGEIFSLEDLMQGPFIPTSSTMFRRGVFGEFPDWFSEMKAHDWALHTLNAQYGNLGYINEIMSATRIHKGGDWNGRNKIEQCKFTIQNREILKKYVPFFKKYIKIQLGKLYFDLAVESTDESDLKTARKAIIKSIIESPINPHIGNTNRFKLLIKLYIPGLNTSVNSLRN